MTQLPSGLVKLYNYPLDLWVVSFIVLGLLVKSRSLFATSVTKGSGSGLGGERGLLLV